MAFFPQIQPMLNRTRTLLAPQLAREERGTFRLHILSAVMMAVAWGVLVNHEYIAAKGLGASVWQITILTMIWPVSNFLSVFLTHWIDGRGCYSKAVLVGGLMRLPLGLMLLSSSVNVMLGLLLLFFASNSVVIPVQNAIIRHRYKRGHRGSLFGWSMSVRNLISLPSSMLVGALLDVDFDLYRIAFLVEALFGAGQAFFFAAMARGMRASPRLEHAGKGVAHFFGSLWRVFNRDREFARFECYFMLYGIAFQAVLPAIPFFARDQLGLSYEQYATAKGVIGQLGLVFLGPFLGAKVERIHPFRFTGIIVLVLALYPLVMAAGGWLPSIGIFLFYASYCFFAIGIAGINVSWNLSSMSFAPSDQAATYQGLHVTATALRGLFAPILGSQILQHLGYTAPFIFSTCLFALSGMLFLGRYARRREAGLVD
ncbi:MFS transporter [Candidatus Fermentibacteria bacterium]|nr:MFS transporter [Candidatus Fermentibacteria bacterium]